LARDFDLIFSTFRLERDYIDAAGHNWHSPDARNLPVRWWSPDVVCKRFKVLRDSREVELVASTGEAT
jgi:hypothetical protein